MQKLHLRLKQSLAAVIEKTTAQDPELGKTPELQCIIRRLPDTPGQFPRGDGFASLLLLSKVCARQELFSRRGSKSELKGETCCGPMDICLATSQPTAEASRFLKAAVIAGMGWSSDSKIGCCTCLVPSLSYYPSTLISSHDRQSLCSLVYQKQLSPC